jgi:hypothetical protein
MSKSLKNFISITAVLERSTARQLRLLFLNQKCVPGAWHGVLLPFCVCVCVCALYCCGCHSRPHRIWR